MRANMFNAILIKTGLAASLLLLANAPSFAQSTVALTAAPQNTTLPDGQVIPMWGYSCGAVAGTGVSCTKLNGAAQTAGLWQPPLITVPSGQPLTITLTNSLTFAGGNVPTSLTIVGQIGGGLGGAPVTTPSPTHARQGATWPASGPADTSATGCDPTQATDPTFCPPGQPPRVQSFGTEVAVGTPRALTWANLRPGTYLIESGTHPSIQGPMGLYGVLVVTNATYPGVTFDTDKAVLMSEIDATQNRAVDLAVRTSGFSETRVWSGQAGDCGDLPPSATSVPGVANTCYPPAVNYDPRYYLINGASFQRANAFSNALAVPSATATQGRVLLRFVNAGLRMHVPSVVGLGMTLYAEDGNILPGLPKVQSEVFLAPGKTYDVTVQPARTGTTYTAATYAVYDRQLSLSTNNQRDGGMQAYLRVAGGAAPAYGAPAAFAVADSYFLVAGNTLTVDDPAKGVIANDHGVYGVTLRTAPTHATSTLTLNPNGTFTYVPGAGVTSDSFSYNANGTTTIFATVTLNACTGACLGAAPTANNDAFTAVVSSRLQRPPPGVLANDTDPSGLPLKASAASAVTGGTVTLSPDGSFIAAPTTPPASGATATVTFQYRATNSQNTSSGLATATVTFRGGNGPAIVVKDVLTGLAINDYRWIIEEDKTFYLDPACMINSTDPLLRPATCPPLPVPTLGTNFHTSYMPMLATGCVVPPTGGVSCEAGQTLLGAAAVCDVGNGACRTGAAQRTPTTPGQVFLDPAKRYYISILPGDGANPVLGGAGGPQQVDPACDPATSTCAMRQFNIATDCGTYTGTGVWAPGGPSALCGHAMGGAQIAAAQTAPISINLQQTPLNSAKISAFVFEDDAPLNGENDAGGGIDILAPNEPGLGGFNIVLFDQAGGFGDATGQITYDMFNMPVSNALAGTIDALTGQDACPITNNPDRLVGQVPTCPKFEKDGVTMSPLAGQALIANLYPGLYEVVAAPGADRIARGEEWLQTNTLDGTKPHEAFIKPGEPSFFQEFGPAGFHVAIGFANPAIINARKPGVCAFTPPAPDPCTSTLQGTVTNARMSRTPDERVYSSGSYDAYTFTTCYVSLGPPDEADFAFEKCKPDGTFQFQNIPVGNFKLTVFDQWNDFVVDGLSTPVKVAGATTQVEIPVTQWRTNVYTRTFIDTNGDGVSQPSEPGLALVSTNVRYRDGSFGFFNNTDLDGYAAFNEVFPFLNWLVVENSTTRFKQTGAHVVYDVGGPVDGSPACDPLVSPCGNSIIAAGIANTFESATAHLPPTLRVPGAVYCATADCTGYSINPAVTGGGTTNVSAANPSAGSINPPWATTYGWQGLLGQNSFIEWGMKPFKPATPTTPGENGGINGHVIYASTRPFDDPSLLLQLSWEPGVPNVKINLYQVGTAADGTRSLKLVDTTNTSSWDLWAQGFRSDGVANMNCPGQEVGSPFYYTLLDTKFWLNPTTPIPGGAAGQNARFKCYDGWSMLNQVQPAPYDGMYKFPSIIGRNPVTGVPTGAGSTNGTPGSRPGSNCTICVANPDDGTPMLPAGKYVVEMVLQPGYELVKEEDKNILLGDVFIAPVTQQFAGLGNVFIMPDQAAVNATYNKNNPLNKTTNLGSITFERHEGDTGTVETFWPCVGAMRVVPDYMSLFPAAGQNSPFAGASRPLCDRKEVLLKDEMTVLAKFYIFSSTHKAAKFTGSITNDFASEFDPFSPQFGEKFAPPNMPVSYKDFAGNEMARYYSDQWGFYNGMTYSSWDVNPPNPTGYAPQVMITCMNDPGPIPDPAHPGQTMTDPFYNAAYSNFCYEMTFMPGQTQYMDTPVIPTASFAAGYNLPDCEFPDTTPAISSVVGDTSNGGRGPWVSLAGHTLTINALGDKIVTNEAYSGPQATGSPFNRRTVTRHYGFGTQATGSSVTIAGVSATVNSWSDTQIVVAVPTIPSTLNTTTGVGSTCSNVIPPSAGSTLTGLTQTPAQRSATSAQNANYRCGQLVITAANGKKSIDAITVTVGGKPPAYVNGENPAGNALQTAIDAATPGDLIIIGPGTYKEMLLMWKPLRLQGVGAGAVTLNADAHPAGRLDPWRKQVNCLFGLAPNGQPASPTNPATPGCIIPTTTDNPMTVDRIPLEGILGWDTTVNGNLAQLLQEPTLMGAYEGAGITVLAKGARINCSDQAGGTVPGCPWGNGDINVATTSHEGQFNPATVHLTNSSADCTAFPSNFWCNPSRIDGLTITNASQGGGAVFAHGWVHNLEVSNNRIRANQGTMSGGITIGQGETADAYLVGNGGDPVGFDQSPWTCVNGSIVGGAANVSPAGFAAGVQLPYCLNTNVKVHNNMIAGNASEGDALFSGTPSGAGGVTFSPGSDYYQLHHNWVCGNLANGDGAGISHSGFIYNGNMSHNTVLFNETNNPTLPTHGGGIGILGAAPDRTITTGPNAGQECGSVTDLDCPPGLSEGTGPGLVIDSNLILGNGAESGSGGGLRLQNVNGLEVSAFPTTPAQWYEVTVTNNIISNNVAGWDGAGVSLQDALKVKFINNTVTSNDTTGTAGVLFNTLGAPNAANPPPGCNPQQDPSLPQDPSCTQLAPDSVNQPAGLVTMRNSPNMVQSLTALSVTCPSGYSYTGGSCATISLPLLDNNLFWHNRAFHMEVGGFGSALQSQQHLVGLVPALDQGLITGTCVTSGLNMAGATVPVVYWDIGVQGDASPTPNSGSGFALHPRFSILTNAAAYPGANNLASDPLVVSLYCNGSRVPPENGGHGYSAPPGRSEVTGLSPIFTMNNITVAATVDEGNNWINLVWGPLALANAATANVAGNVAQAPLGNDSLQSTSPAIDKVTTAAVTYAEAPSLDFFGAPRKIAGNLNVDIGAVEFQPLLPGAFVAPTSINFGSVTIGTTSTRSVVLTNNGQVSLSITSIAISGSARFTRVAGVNNCGTTLAVGASCSIYVQFAPLTNTLQSGTLNVIDNAGTQSTTLSGS